MRVVARLVASKIGEEPTDLDKVLESLGVDLPWIDKIMLVQNMEGVEAVYHAVSGKILVRRVNAARA
ncbi:hypothetical protein [Pyrobaculum neutrophilum]|uniref:Uncharacterized protein n=1 Tax=Pyrobaculum neutrophilum (strain DSM 2338 / JCM 9278 / NBRC 100436 / V24Sta) TaxID=444157 RepID=B1YDG7_PYRNV|nr:conserved hypothetical protein [Pyrobaculum neutrophilum V24Sta]